jgi:glycosyltransferase involved in cell wall biosynthesis
VARVSEPALSVVIPVYNEEAEIGRILRAVRGALEARGGDWEILVVDNASTDRTRELASTLLEGERVRLLANDANRGKGYSIRRGMLEARGELRLMCDADCEPSLASLGAMLAAARDADVVVGSRLAPEAEVVRAQPLRRRLVGSSFLLLCRAIMRPPAKDVFCGFKLFRADAAEAVFARTRLDGWSFDVEALSLAQALGYRVRSCGIVWVNRPDSRLSIRSTIVPVVRELLAARRYVRGVAAGHAAQRAESQRDPVESLL